MKEKSAGAVIFRKDKENRFLLLNYSYKASFWDFPKGNIEKDESETDTIKREVEEETGIKKIYIIPDFMEKISYVYKREGETVFKEVVFYLAETKEKKVKLSKEHIGFKWLDYEEALETLTYPAAKNILKKADEFLKSRKQKQLFDFK